MDLALYKRFLNWCGPGLCWSFATGSRVAQRSQMDQRTATFSLLQFAKPDGELWTFAVLLIDTATDKLHVRSRHDFESLDPAMAEVIHLFLEEIDADAKKESGEAILQSFEDRLSNAIRITDRIHMQIAEVDAALECLSEAYLN